MHEFLSPENFPASDDELKSALRDSLITFDGAYEAMLAEAEGELPLYSTSLGIPPADSPGQNIKLYPIGQRWDKVEVHHGYEDVPDSGIGARRQRTTFVFTRTGQTNAGPAHTRLVELDLVDGMSTPDVLTSMVFASDDVASADVETTFAGISDNNEAIAALHARLVEQGSVPADMLDPTARPGVASVQDITDIHDALGAFRSAHHQPE